MKPKSVALAGILLSALIGGVLDVLCARASGGVKLWIDLGPIFIGLAFTFMWLHHDGLQVGYRRSALLNVGIIVMGIIFIPVYFYKSRPTGARGPMCLRFFGFCLLWIAFSAIGFYGARAAT
ncbi:MAG: hypothetical protein JWN94_4265 [Betaproteobacteria bacterium]|nr:hypothetical protein [Betaproteobacteria bacterium]